MNSNIDLIKFPKWLERRIPLKTEQCKRLKILTLRKYRGIIDPHSYRAEVGCIKYFIEPFTIDEFLKFPEPKRKQILDTWDKRTQRKNIKNVLKKHE